MDDFQEPTERPATITRDYVEHLLSGICVAGFPSDLRAPFLNYLVASGVVKCEGVAYSLPGAPEALRALPREARRSLSKAVVAHARSGERTRALLWVLATEGSGGGGTVSQGT